MSRALVVALAVVAAIAPLPPRLVERAYSSSAYPLWQMCMTVASNAFPFALIDVLLGAVAIAWIAMVAFEWRARRTPIRAIGRVAARTCAWAAVIYLVFLASWGLNYRRVRLAEKLALDNSRVTTDAVAMLASTAVAELNALYERAHQTGWPDADAVDDHLGAGLAFVESALHQTRLAIPARPKHTVLNAYFRRAAVDGMTDPFFLETLVNSDLLPMERPFVVAHEWAHLAGYNDEGEANFVAFLVCMRSDEPRRYSAWMAIYSEASAMLSRAARQALAARLAPGPRADLRAIADRVARHVSVRVSQAGWRVYNEYLKANRVEAGAASYSEVIRLVLGTALGSGVIGATDASRGSLR